jgi:cytochrome c551
MKKWLGTISGVLFVLALTAACSTTGQGQQAGEKSGDPQKIFQAKCASCHGQNLEGRNAPSLAKVGSKYKSVDELTSVILNGQGGMPGGLVNQADAKKLAEWLMTKK